ncbi:hypothetical protein BD324DRAFT_613003 [Kockovaella imperatae]|uniref:Uncharacterized protein n=1 Tax=Kockovaella imperatae TaxID=4999 RepID=A0A1Y1UU25_9TREE|nr:hypothetical protein BD324DRAFT_613003 [Kockovaella imperatae]ORX41044.1 hypothetical protein BD324DRAFT_613003 [Kockovaella imperatae]
MTTLTEPTVRQMTDSTLSSMAKDILDRSVGPHKTSSSSNQVPQAEDGHADGSNDLVKDLAVHLYALHELETHVRLLKEGQENAVRNVIVSELQTTRTSERLNSEIWSILDQIEHRVLSGSQLSSPTNGSAGAVVDNQEDDASVEQGASIRLDDLLWSRFHVDEKGSSVTALDLLLPPYGRGLTQSPLSHPLVKILINVAWTCPIQSTRSELGRIRLDESHGRDELERGVPKQVGQSGLRKAYSKLESCITPSRQHKLGFISFGVLYCLTLALSTAPGTFIVPYTYINPQPQAMEIIYILWATAFVIASLQSRSTSRILLTIPTFLCLHNLFSPPSAYSFLCLSIPTLTIALIVPRSLPSLVYLFPETLPLSAILATSLGRAIRSLTLLGPLALFLFIILASSMNGDSDLWVIFGNFSSDMGTTLSQLVSAVGHGAMGGEPPVAPYEARQAIFISLSLLLAFSIPLAIAQSYPPTTISLKTPSSSRGVASTSSEVVHDDLDRNYSPYIALSARTHWARSVNHYLSPRPILPFNILTLPLELIAAGVMIRPIPLEKAKAIRSKVLAWNEVLAVLITAPLCFLLGLLERFTRVRGTKNHKL